MHIHGGRLCAGELLCAEAEGIFVSIGRERFEQLAEAQARREQESR